MSKEPFEAMPDVMDAKQLGFRQELCAKLFAGSG